MAEIPNTTNEFLFRWLREILVNEEGHYNAAKRCRLLNRVLGIPTVVFTAFVASSAYLALDYSSDSRYKIAATVVGTVAVILTSVQTFSGFGDRAQSHKIAGAEFSSIRRELESLTNVGSVATQKVEDVRARIDRVTQEAPEVPRRIWDAAKSSLGESSTYWSGIGRIS